jgi:hypothetical protein
VRYPHFLRPANGGCWPVRVLAVDCEGVLAHAESNRGVQSEVLASWHCRELVMSGYTYAEVSRSTGTTADAWWALLGEMLTDTRPTWLLSESCGRVWPLLGLWERIESGRVKIVGTDPWVIGGEREQRNEVRREQQDRLGPSSSGAVNRAKERTQGLLVVADPPNILTARVTGAACRVTWVDARNYSVALPTGIEHGVNSVVWIVSFWCRYHALCKSLNLGSAQTTTGSQSLHGWRVGYYTGGVYAGGGPEVEELERAALIGGRCEAYRIGELPGPVHHLDIRSSYAAQCESNSVPIRISKIIKEPSIDALDCHVRMSTCIASVRLCTDERAYPYRRNLAPSEGADDTKGARTGPNVSGGMDIIYPVGEYDAVLCGPELYDALDYGRVTYCYQLVIYDSAPILSRYAKDVYAARCAAEDKWDVDIASVCKSLLVSIVGKFGQRERRWVHCPNIWTDLLYGEWYGSDELGRGCRYRSLGGVVQRDEILGLSVDAVPAVAAWILSAARMRLLQLIRIAGWDQTYYCDTDSLMVSCSGFERLLNAGELRDIELGSLYKKGLHKDVEIRGHKHYVEDGRVVCSGLPRGQCVDAGDGVHYWYHSHAQTDAARRQRPTADRVLRKYERIVEYHGGIVRDDGRVDPIVVG